MERKIKTVERFATANQRLFGAEYPSDRGAEPEFVVHKQSTKNQSQ